MADEEQNPQSLSDEELDAKLEGKESPDEGTETDTSENNIELDEQETESPDEGTETDELPDYVPEDLREHYKKKNIDEITKTAAHWQKVAGKYSNYSALVELMEADPSIKANIIRVASGQQLTEPKQTDTKPSQQEQVYQAMIDQGMPEELVNYMKAQDSKIQQLESSLTGDKQQEIQLANEQTVQSFYEKFKLPQDQLAKFLVEAERTVRPTGRKGEYTPEDLEAAYVRLHPQEYRQRLESEIRASIGKKLENAQNGNEEATVSASAHHDNHVNGNRTKLEQAKSVDEMADSVGALSDEELDQMLGERKIASHQPWRP